MKSQINNHSELKAHLAVFGTTLFFSINFSVVKILFDSCLIKPFGLNFIRILVTTILLWSLFLFKKQKQTLMKLDNNFNIFFLNAFCSGY